ncbi:MAG: hypothetical protein ACFB11_21370 [Paracoccaceae bacterium]
MTGTDFVGRASGGPFFVAVVPSDKNTRKADMSSDHAAAESHGQVQ